MLARLLCLLSIFCAAPADPVGPPNTACPSHFWTGRAPAPLNPKLARETYPLCMSGYGTLFSGLTRTPVYSAEHLTAARVQAARVMIRVDAFHAEPLLPDGVRSELADYRHSGYDRGHLAPNGDMGDATSQGESFSLANMIPQDHDDNAGLWAAIEDRTRDTAVDDGEIYVVTGPLYEGSDVEALNGRVLVPTGIWKAIYDPVSGEAGAYVVDNRPGWDYRTLSIEDLETLAGLDPFPGLAAAVKASAPDLPPVAKHRQAGGF